MTTASSSTREPAAAGSLSGLRVIDASRVLGGPYCAQILGDHGAEVIKIEPPQGDETRAWGPPFQGDAASYFLGLNRNKKCIAIDLSLPAGRELLLELLASADVFIENFKTGTLERWGIGCDVLQERFPSLVHCRVSGFGADGPYGGRPGYDAVIQALCGLMSVNGEKGGEPLRMGIPVVDMVTGLNAALGILMALQERQRSGRGQFVEAALYDCGISLMHPHLPNHYLGGKVPAPSGNAHPNITPYDTYATASQPLFLAVGNNRQFERLCGELGKPELAGDERFATNAARGANRSALKEEIEALLASHEADEISQRLIAAGVPCGPVRSIDAVVADPHTAAREMIVDIGDYRGTGSPIKLSRTPATYRQRPPAFAEHTDEILRARGISIEQYADAVPRTRKPD
ncbi:CoA transferase [Aquamicrobium sp. LC103]|uniref:CaiB/BaiF CoA transferase family protein n=1 Tax=Aquamicrobium sp. LC103 TaxID=1120658 RepID=UPI00063EC56E|nr:CoA transferase [Aquamicrobium sp. LC103]TKT69640.1 CoA transferase [Aquamicrobium sp. LC103]